MEHWAGRWNKQKTPPVLPTPRACRSDCPEGNTDRTTVFYHLRAGLSKYTHGGVFYGKTNQHGSLAPHGLLRPGAERYPHRGQSHGLDALGGVKRYMMFKNA